jgi:hypothetical protein
MHDKVSHIFIFRKDNNDVYERYNINFISLNHLESIGLIRHNSMVGFRLLNLPKQFTIFYFGCPINIVLKEGTSELITGDVFLTQVGKELLSICNAVPIDELKNAAIDVWVRNGISII